MSANQGSTHTTQGPSKKEVLADIYVPSREEIRAIESWKMDWYYTNMPKWLEAIEERGWNDDLKPDEDRLLEQWENKDHHGWKKLRESIKWVALQDLINIISKENNVVEVTLIVMDTGYALYPDKNIIVGTKGKPSIISVLHELGHHIKGDSELNATRYAIGIFSVCFPEAYAKLKWTNGSFLIRTK